MSRKSALLAALTAAAAALWLVQPVQAQGRGNCGRPSPATATSQQFSGAGQYGSFGQNPLLATMHRHHHQATLTAAQEQQLLILLMEYWLQQQSQSTGQTQQQSLSPVQSQQQSLTGAQPLQQLVSQSTPLPAAQGLMSLGQKQTTLVTGLPQMQLPQNARVTIGQARR